MGTFSFLARARGRDVSAPFETPNYFACAVLLVFATFVHRTASPHARFCSVQSTVRCHFHLLFRTLIVNRLFRFLCLSFRVLFCQTRPTACIGFHFLRGSLLSNTPDDPRSCLHLPPASCRPALLRLLRTFPPLHVVSLFVPCRLAV